MSCGTADQTISLVIRQYGKVGQCTVRSKGFCTFLKLLPLYTLLMDFKSRLSEVQTFSFNSNGLTVQKYSRRVLSTAPHSVFTTCSPLSPHLCTTGFVVIQQSSTDHSLVMALHKFITDRCVITCRCVAGEGGTSPLRPATAQKPSHPDTQTHKHTYWHSR